MGADNRKAQSAQRTQRGKAATKRVISGETPSSPGMEQEQTTTDYADDTDNRRPQSAQRAQRGKAATKRVISGALPSGPAVLGATDQPNLGEEGEGFKLTQE